MKYATPILIALAGATAVPAQTSSQVMLPTQPVAISNNNYPFAGPIMRYQQWFSAGEWIKSVGRPVRVTGVDFFAGSPGGQTGAQIEIEVTLANGPSQPSSFLDSNLLSGAVVVVPRSKQTLGTATAGTVPLSLNFQQYSREFIWDGRSPVVMEIKLYDNGKGNGPYNYDLQATFTGVGKVWRLWGLGSDPDGILTAGFSQPSAGLMVRFTYEDGVSVPYGSGCPGAGNVVPVATTSGGHPLPGNAAWTQLVTQANSGTQAVLLFGISNTMWGPLQLPADLSVIGANGCQLLTDVQVTRSTKTSFGGVGTSVGTFATPIPPVTIFYGQSMYTQWILWDTQAPNGVLATSQGIRHVFG